MDWAKIAGFLVIAYLVFTTTKGNLRKWLETVGLKSSSAASPTIGQASSIGKQ